MRGGATVLSLLLLHCGGPRNRGTANGRTGDDFVDACLHWTACITPPPLPPSATRDNLAYCLEGFITGGRLPWPKGDVAVTAAQRTCIADANLDCTKALDCVSTPAPTPCPSPTWTCNGDTIEHCDSFSGYRIVTEDCAASGLHCIAVGNAAQCGLATCDPKTFTGSCAGNLSVTCQTDGILVVVDDCGAHDATCVSGTGCVGNGPSCTRTGPLSPIACRGDVLITCDNSGHEEQTDCTATGEHCIMINPNPAGVEFSCGTQPGGAFCQVGPNWGLCDGTALDYCDDHGNQRLDCKSLGYHDCLDGHCVL
jgi:hypothetical protein